MPADSKLNQTIIYTIITIITFLILQSLLVLMHEFTHSTTAWLLGCKENPLGIVWGNPVMLTGWDEGVHYSKLFLSPGNIKETAIGAMPLLLHAIIVTLGLIAMSRNSVKHHRWLMHTIYWFIIANIMELTAYIIMRPFEDHGDTGHFNHGLNLSPWYLFIIGSILILYAFHLIFTSAMPALYTIFAKDNTQTRWVILLLTSFITFLWGSGLRILLYVYPDKYWQLGLLGFAGFIITTILFRPKPIKNEAARKTAS